MYTVRNRYYKNSKISEARFRRLLTAFAMDFSASDTARLTGISVRSVNAIYLKIRVRIAEYCESQSPYSGEVELNESYVGPKRIRGKRGRGAGGETIVFDIFKRNGHVFTEIVPDGVVASGTEQYYAFDYANVPVVSLDSQLSIRDSALRKKMNTWLIKDLKANQQDWTIAIFHHPPHSKGSHDSDEAKVSVSRYDLPMVYLRKEFTPIFEQYGVDLTYAGHSHAYERLW